LKKECFKFATEGSYRTAIAKTGEDTMMMMMMMTMTTTMIFLFYILAKMKAMIPNRHPQHNVAKQERTM